MTEKKNQKRFLEEWLKDPELAIWLARVKDDDTKARCTTCQKTIALSTSGKSALADHSKGKKHKEAINRKQNFFKPKSSATSSVTPKASTSLNSTQNTSHQSTLETVLSDTHSTSKCEIIWILKCLMSGTSARFNDDIGEILTTMFPNIAELKEFSLGRTKSMYVINHGLAPYFKGLLSNALEKSTFHVYSFDESLNDVTQTSEMDLYVRYWDDLDKLVKVRYYGSSFLGHCKATNLLQHFKDITTELKSESLYQISMDGPNVNKKFFDDFSTEFKENNFHQLIDIGSCSLHIVHGAFKTGAEKSEWKLKQFLKGAFTIFHNSPARREDFESVTGSSLYPLSFCATRWVENKKVAERMIAVMEDVKKVSAFWDKLPKSKQSSCKSYTNLKDGLEDLLIFAKLNFFSYVANIIEPFLKKFQTDKPMVPFLFFELKTIVSVLLEIVVKAKVIKSCKNANQLMKIDLSNEANLLPLHKMNLGFAVEKAIEKEKHLDTVNTDTIKKFNEGCQKFIIAMLLKLFERSPLHSKLLRSASVLDPSKMILSTREKLLEKWKLLLKCLVEVNVCSSQMCDKATSEFKSFVDDELPKHRVEFEKFCCKDDRLDRFYFHTVAITKYQNFSFVTKLILTLSHGQATVERGFSNNNYILKTNMSAETVIAKRLIKDHMLANNLKAHTIEISKPMVKAFRNAHAVYKEKLEEERRNAKLTERETQATHISRDIEKMNQHVNQMTKSIDTMDRDFVEYMVLAEKNNDLSLVRKGNELKRKCNETKDARALIEKEILNLKDKKRKLLS